MKTVNGILSLMLIAVSLSFSGCGDSKELIDNALNPPERKPIDASRTGVNNFFVQREFGSVSAQHSEIKDVLRLKHVRVLFAWTDSTQPTPDSAVNYGFFDQIIDNIPSGQDVLIVLAHTPSWMTNSANWIDGNPRKTWVERWLKPTVEHFRSKPRIVGWEIWNEPDLTVVASDSVLGLENPSNYLELLTLASTALSRLDPTRLKVIAATESIQQDFPLHLDYNKALKAGGAENLVDVWNIHYYGKAFETVIASGGIADFLNSLIRPIWVTESGEQGPTNQLAYVEQVWPFLQEEVPGIERFYYYEFASTAPLASNYGLKTNDPSQPVSDLYVHLRDR